MIMRAKQEGNVLVFELEGHLDFETTLQFQETCKSLLEKSPSKRAVFDLSRLKFVGSTGINQFVRALKDFNSGKSSEKPKLCGVSVEFDKVIRAYQTARNPFEIFPDPQAAIAAFDVPAPAPVRATRKKKRRKLSH